MFRTSAVLGFSQVMVIQMGIMWVLIYTLCLNQKERRVPLKNCYTDMGACLTFVTIWHDHKDLSLSEPAVFIASSAISQIQSMIELFVLHWQILQ